MGRLVAALTLLLAASSALATEAQPRLELDAADRLLITDLPPAILQGEEVARHLTSGLTTTLVLTVEASLEGVTRLETATRIAVRFELWDEIFQVAVLGDSGSSERSELESIEQLATWWASLRLPVLALPQGAVGSGPVRITLDVLPFSRSEELDTERWFSESMQRAEEGRGAGISHPAEGEETLGKVFDILIATSIRRRSLISISWTIPWPKREQP